MKRTLLWLIPLLVVGALAGRYFWPASEKPSPEPLAQPAADDEPKIQHPVEPVAVPTDPLPRLAESDGPLRDALTALLGDRLPKYIYLKDIIRRIVATVDNLPRDHVALNLMPVRPVPGLPATAKRGDSLVLSPKNAERYRLYMRLMDAVPTNEAVALYARFYPLFQEQYENLGYPGRYFNDRAVEVIDHLLATPELEEPPLLVQPKVLYEFADPKLEQLSAGQKILLRIGRANEFKVKAKLQEVRRALVSLAPPSPPQNP
jgi:hypothetical protein